MTVLVTGVRGTIGRLVADALHASGADVRATSSDPAAVTGAPYPVLPVDLRAGGGGLDTALDGADRVFLYAAQNGAADIADRMRAAGVAHVVLLSSSEAACDPAAAGAPGASGIGDHHRAVEDAVRGYGGTWTFLRPAAFATNTLRWAPGIRAGHLALPCAGAHVEPVHEADIADAAVAALTAPGHEGRAYYLTGGASLTQREQVGIIARAAGHPVTVEDQDPAAWREEAVRHMPAPIADALLAMWRSALAGPGRTDGTVRDVTGAPPRPFADWAAAHADTFRR